VTTGRGIDPAHFGGRKPLKKGNLETRKKPSRLEPIRKPSISFSNRDSAPLPKVTEVFLGRGIGMDVVRTVLDRPQGETVPRFLRKKGPRQRPIQLRGAAPLLRVFRTLLFRVGRPSFRRSTILGLWKITRITDPEIHRIDQA